MKTKKFLASVMSAALGITTVLPAGLSEINTSDIPFVAYADDNDEYTLGDVNGDKAIDAGDASIVLAEYSVLSIGGDGTFKKNQRKSADVDKNDIINSADATLILAYYSYTSTGGKLDMQAYLDERNNQQSGTTTTTAKKTTSSTTTKTTASSTLSNATTTKSTATSASTTTLSTTSSTTATTTVSSSTTTTVTTNPNKVSAIRLTRTEMQIRVGCGELSAYVTMLPETASNKGERWSSSDESIAVVDNEGWIIAKKAGKCLITVHSIDNPDVSASVRVTVYDGEIPPETATASLTTAPTTSTTTATETTATSNIKVEEIRLSKYEMTIPVGKEDISIVTMLPYDAINKDEIWISSDEKIATVNKYGWVKGISIGKCTVTVYSVSNPAIKAEIAVKVVSADTEVPNPDVNFSYVIGDKSDDKNLAFCTPFPKNASGRFIIDYVITDSNGKVTTISTTTILAPEMSSVITMLTSNTNNFTVEEYITNLATNERAKIGKYSLCLSPLNASSLEEDILSAFSLINGLK